MNNNVAVFGAQEGDEAKASIANYLSKDFDIVVRFSSGGNCGSTIYYKGKKIVRHHIPAADFSLPKQKAFLGAGMVINLETLLKEVLDVEENFPGAASRIIVDPDAFAVLQKHIDEDKSKNTKEFGSTGQGITPAYTDKIARKGVKIRQLLKDNAEIIKPLKDFGVQFKPVLEMYEEFRKSKVLFIGGQSVLLEYNHGNYPYVTSGECSLGGIFNAGFAFCAPNKVYGVCKPYITKVDGGAGKFLTELPEERAKIIREIGKERGATTGRDRRIGALDLVALKYAVIKGGITNLAMTKMDVLNGDRSVMTCTAYEGLDMMYSGNDMMDAKPVYLDLPGWKDAKDTLQTKSFLEYVEKFVGVPIDLISTGVNREDIIDIKSSSNGRLMDPFSIPEITLN